MSKSYTRRADKYDPDKEVHYIFKHTEHMCDGDYCDCDSNKLKVDIVDGDFRAIYTHNDKDKQFTSPQQLKKYLTLFILFLLL